MRKALYILGQLTDLDVEWLITEGVRQSVHGGDVLIREGQPVESLFLVLSGDFAVVSERMGAKELARLGAGEIVGEMSFVDAAPPSATVRAEGDGAVLAIPKEVLHRKLASDPHFAVRFYRALACFLSDRLRATVEQAGPGGGAASIEEGFMQDDELDLNVLDNVHLAGARFDTILKRLSGR